jgi:uncharacterized protein (TIGR02145 family)
LVNLAIGTGSVVTGDFSAIDWRSSEHYIQIEVDTSGGTDYFDMGTSQLLAVPYALFSEQTGDTSMWQKTQDNTVYYDKGTVGIGTSCTDTNAMLYVNGSIRVESPFIYNGDNGWSDTVNQVTAFDFANDKLKYRTYKYCGGIITYISEESEWVSSVGGFLLPGTSSFSCGDTLFDSRDGQSYPTVLIGTQCWMARNLNAGTRVNGFVGVQQDNGTIEKYCFNNNSADCDEYGGLYIWNEAMQYTTQEGTQGICPYEWHLPTDQEFNLLETFLGGSDVAGGKMKETGTVHWNTPNTDATNESGFTGLGSGFFIPSSNFVAQKWIGKFWSSSHIDANSSWSRALYYDSASVTRSSVLSAYMSEGLSIRCVLDTCSPRPSQANAGTDQLNLTYNVTTLQGNTPTNGCGLWTIQTGTGGTLAEPTSPTTTFMGTIGSSYSLLWTISNDCGASYDEVVVSFSASAFSCGQNLVDSRDGKSYATLLIGTQCWMAQNLNVGVMVNSNMGGFLQTDNGTIEKYCYNNDPDVCDVYGGLYQWDEAMQYDTLEEGAQGICPVSWHIPSDNEWKELEGTVDSLYPVGDAEWDNINWRGSDAGGNLKDTGTTHWNPPNTDATNESGFFGFGGGRRHDYMGFFYNLGEYGYFWTSTDGPDFHPWIRILGFDSGKICRSYNSWLVEEYGYSARCIKDL